MTITLPGTTKEQCQKFEQYLSLLLKWNKIHNLTAIRSSDEVVTRHFLESIQLIPHLGTPTSILDLGTGAGFPGLPIAIMRHDWKMTVLDSIQKKVSFCQEVIRVCGLTNATAIVGRAENIDIIDKLGKFDTIISRATWSLADYLPIAIPYLSSHGSIYAMKGPRASEEIQAVAPLSIAIKGPDVTPLTTLGHSDQNLVVIKYWAE